MGRANQYDLGLNQRLFMLIVSLIREGREAGLVTLLKVRSGLDN